MANPLLLVGYNRTTMESKIYITRRTDLFHPATDGDITLQEWLTFVANDPEMRLDNNTTVILPDGEVYSYPSPGKAVYLQRRPGELDVKEVTFDFTTDGIVVDSGDPQVLNKIRHIAYKLNTRIFKETSKFTEQVAVEPPVLIPRFSFSSLVSPFKKVIPQIRYFLQQYAFSLSGNNPEKVKDQ